MRVCYFGTYRSGYARNQILIEGLRRNGVEVVECHETLWYGTEDRVEATLGGWRSPKFWWRVLKTYARLIRRHRICDYDIMVVGYPGQFDVYLARLLTWLRRKPLVWDIFMSIYLIALERNLHSRSPFTVAALRKIEKLACQLPEMLILDTQDYVVWFGETHQIPSSRFRLVPTGADDRVFYQRREMNAPSHQLQVMYHGSFIPNHGVKCIIDAARLLAGERHIHFTLIGDGPERELAETAARDHRLPNVTFTGWLDKEALVQHLSAADICLGVFGDTPQSLMTVQNKIYECLAMGIPMITGDSPAIRRDFLHMEHVYLCRRGDAQALADAILRLISEPSLRTHLSTSGHELFIKRFTTSRLGQQFHSYINEIIH